VSLLARWLFVRLSYKNECNLIRSVTTWLNVMKFTWLSTNLIFKWFRLQSGIRNSGNKNQKHRFRKTAMLKDPSHLEPKAFKSNKIMIMAPFRMLLCWSNDYFVIITLKVVFFYFQTSCIAVFMFLKKKILKVIEYKLRSDNYNIFSSEPDGGT
jgi:hypothetical protein